jgi:hypothetical protein
MGLEGSFLGGGEPAALGRTGGSASLTAGFSRAVFMRGCRRLAYGLTFSKAVSSNAIAL